MLDWLRQLLVSDHVRDRLRFKDDHIDLARVQYEERVARREALDREFSGLDAQACFARVRRRMAPLSGPDPDPVWIPPLYNAEPSYREWRRRHRRRRIDNVSQIDERKKA